MLNNFAYVELLTAKQIGRHQQNDAANPSAYAVPVMWKLCLVISAAKQVC